MKISNASIIFWSHFNTWIIRNSIGGDGNPAPFTLYISMIDYRFREGFDLVSCCQDGCRAARLAYEDVSWLFSTEICRELCVDLYRTLIQTLNLHDQPWKQTLCLNVKTPFRSRSRVLAMWCDVMWAGGVQVSGLLVNSVYTNTKLALRQRVQKHNKSILMRITSLWSSRRPVI